VKEGSMFESKWDLPRIGEPVVMFCARCGGKLELLLEAAGMILGRSVC